MRNLLTDVPGVKVGQAESPSLATGVTAIIFDAPAIAGVDVRGGAPGTRETDLLQPGRLIEKIDAVVFSGGSAFGLSAADGVMAELAERRRGYEIGSVRVPIVPAAILFDLHDDIEKDWGRYPPYRELGFEAATKAGMDFRLGPFGAGRGATTANCKGGTGSASAVTSFGVTVGALAVVNAYGAAHFKDSPCFFAGGVEENGEYGGYGLPSAADTHREPQTKAPRQRANTTLGILVTDAVLTKQQCHALATAAHEGFKLALFPVHTAYDGDTIFAAATGLSEAKMTTENIQELEVLSARVMARAIARGIYEANQEL